MANEELEQQTHPPPFNPELLERMLSLQEAEIGMRAKELELRQLEITKTHEFSKDGLDAQLTDRQNTRIAKQKSDNTRYAFLAIIALAVIAFLVFALWTNKDAVAMEIVKAVGFVIAGYFGGKYHQKSKDDKAQSE